MINKFEVQDFAYREHCTPALVNAHCFPKSQVALMETGDASGQHAIKTSANSKDSV